VILSLKKGETLLYPRTDQNIFIAENALLIGDVRVGENSSIWYNVVIRADVNWVEIGRGTNIQDGVIIHVETASYPTFIGDYVTIGHRAVIHGCVIKDFSLIGIGAIVMNGAEVGPFSIVGAGALLTENTKIPPGTLALGVPAKVKRDLTEQEINALKISSQRYIELSKMHLKFAKDIKSA